MESVKVIADKKGRKYLAKIIDSSEETSSKSYIFVVHLIHRNTQVGITKCFVDLEEKSICLADITICNEVERNLEDRIKAFFLNDPKTYRRLGLGSELLKIVIEKAQKSGVQCLYGRVTQQDFKDNPNLLNWYKKFGFCVEPPLPKDASKDIARICLYFKPMNCGQ
ncbi:MAG: GNAT family N-acetyltransferase [Cyanobacteriota bacterium]